MSPTDRYIVRFVESFPTPLEPAILYVSVAYSTAGHLCACGCGGEVVTKLSPARWRVSFDGEISLSPSVAATALPCNSHYFITRGEVDWRRPLSELQTNRAQIADRRAINDHRAAFPRQWWKRLFHRRW
ncbi:DUF6527 family protein [Salinibacterium soli]|uniref:DUF6527 family protein n=1 Tax=Antiquaquibacter soli TaxID=3064523 RepID=A0ABT9BRP9_9MICO|nr:DUF6527 family protein [Protaetiibacter sp. WY-16]MDO7883118.1 DUF6527 family protein [Protaetiibacter sp. WY-16]